MSTGSTTSGICAGRSSWIPVLCGHAQFIGEHPDVLKEGFVTKVEERHLERWVCEPCFEDFATEFGWALSPVRWMVVLRVPEKGILC
jgi:hypothetical protein